MILIVDDQPENIYSLRKLLESRDFKVDTAESGEAALKKILQNEYRLIILDVQMPGIDGFEVAETLSGYSKTKDIPIIFLSAANTDKEFITQGYASGGVDYVTKPVDPDILMLKVKTFSKLYEQQRSLNRTQDALRLEIETRKKAQTELKEQVDQLHKTLESLPQIAFTATSEGEIDFVNKQWFQYSSSMKQFPPTYEGERICEKWAVYRKNGSPFELEVRIKALQSEVFRYHLLRIIPIKEKDSVVSWVGTFTDIDDQKQIEKRKDEFLSIASHELKTPLTSVKAYIQLLDRSIEKKPGESASIYISRVQDQLKKLDSLIADLLDISTIENGKLKLNRKVFDFEQFLDHVIQTVHHTHDRASPVIERVGDAIDVLVTADEIRIEQVLINYLTNAIKYSPGSDRVIVTTEKGDNHVKVSVRDFGIGVPEDKKHSVFDKFYRVEESSVKFQGLGIGLYICSEIIRQHGGTYGVESHAGEGSTFYFTIPLD